MSEGTVWVSNPYSKKMDISTQWTIIEEIALSLGFEFEKDEVTVDGPWDDSYISVIRGAVLGVSCNTCGFTEPISAYQYLRYLAFRYKQFELPMYLWGG